MGQKLEPGWTSYKHELLEALCRAPLPGGHRRVFDALMRLTVGWSKPTDLIAVSQIADMTALSREDVKRALADLERWQLVTVERMGPRRSSRLGPQTDFTRWSIGETATAQRLRKRALGRSNTPARPHPSGAFEHPSVGRSNTPDLGRSNTPTRERENLQRNQSQSSAGSGSFNWRPGLPNVHDVTREDVESTGRCMLLWQHAVAEGWDWAGDAGLIAWFTLREHVLAKRGNMRDRLRTFAHCARQGLRHGSPTDEDNARRVLQRLRGPTPLPPAVDALVDELGRVLQ